MFFTQTGFLSYHSYLSLKSNSVLPTRWRLIHCGVL